MDIDSICIPVDLVDDTTPDAIPYPWTDAVPYYAAYICYMNSSRAADAMRMFSETQPFGQYQIFMRRARKMSEGSSKVPDQYAEGF